MRTRLALLLILLLAVRANAQPADCASAPPPDAVPLALNFAGLPGVPSNFGGQAYVNVPMSAGGMTCTGRRPAPRDILRGEPGDVLHGERGNLLSGPSP
jgi:hypothetical protein